MLAQDWMDVLTVVGLVVGLVMVWFVYVNTHKDTIASALPIVGMVCLIVVFLMFPMGVMGLMAMATVLAWFFGVFQS